MWRKILYGCWLVLSAVGTVLGIAGWSDDATGWWEWLQMNSTWAIPLTVVGSLSLGVWLTIHCQKMWKWAGEGGWRNRIWQWWGSVPLAMKRLIMAGVATVSLLGGAIGVLLTRDSGANRPLFDLDNFYAVDQGDGNVQFSVSVMNIGTRPAAQFATASMMINAGFGFYENPHQCSNRNVRANPVPPQRSRTSVWTDPVRAERPAFVAFQVWYGDRQTGEVFTQRFHLRLGRIDGTEVEAEHWLLASAFDYERTAIDGYISRAVDCPAFTEEYVLWPD